MKIYILFILFFITHLISAQEYQFEDQIKFKNGHVLTGEIIEYRPDDLVVFQLKGGNSIEIPVSYIARIWQDAVSIKASKPNQFKDRGVYFVLNGSTSFSEEKLYSLTHTIGFRFNRYIGIGIGAGLENFEDGEGKRVVPFYGEARGFLLDKKISPYYSLRAGYGIGLKNKDFNIEGTSGGWHLNPEIGYRLGGYDAINVMIGVGMKFQDVTFHYESPWDGSRSTDFINYRRYTVTLGLVF